METTKKKSYQAKKNEGNDLFFIILKNILTTKSVTAYNEHINNPTFGDVYNNVSVEKALVKCQDYNIVKALIELQTKYSFIEDKEQHYYYMLNKLPKTYKWIDWKQV